MKKAIKNLIRMIQQVEPIPQLEMVLWDGESLGCGGRPRVSLRIKAEIGARRLIGDGFLGFGEAYMQGDLDVEGDMQELLRLGFAINLDRAQPSFWKKLRLLPAYLKTRNSIHGAPQNISRHYDLGEDFYALFLDPSMSYSCAYFRSGEDSLEQAQKNKFEHISRKLMLKPGERLLDIGCGWGGMLIYAAGEYGVEGLGLTLSRNQYQHANEKIRSLGLQDRIRVVLEDYRNVTTGAFDKVVSIGMFEHVGKHYISLFMGKVSSLLKKGGLGLLHTIGKEVYSPADAWIMRYIFPGGYLPNLPEIAHAMGQTGLCTLDVENLRLHYVHTLDHWAANFEKNAGAVRDRFGESFVRMWRLYLNASSAGFKWGENRLYQILFSKGLRNDLPLTREHCYSNFRA